MSLQSLRNGFVVFIVSACASSPPSLLPTTADGKLHFNAGQKFLDLKDYARAEAELTQAITAEPLPYIPHAKLAAAFIGQQKYLEAANAFKTAFGLYGEGSELAILQAVYLRRGHRNDDARRLLTHWSGPDVTFTGYGSYSVGARKLPGWFKEAGTFLLGELDAQTLLQHASVNEKPYAYLFIALAELENGKLEKAEEFLQLTQGSALHPSSWVHDVVNAEFHNLHP